MSLFEKATAAVLVIVLSFFGVICFVLLSVFDGETNGVMTHPDVRSTAGIETTASAENAKDNSIEVSTGRLVHITSEYDLPDRVSDDPFVVSASKHTVDSMVELSSENPWFPTGETDHRDVQSVANGKLEDKEYLVTESSISATESVGSASSGIIDSGNKRTVIQGIVVDHEYKPIPGYVITAKQAIGSGITHTSKTDVHGHFRFTGIGNGEYLLKTQEHAFFNTVSRRVRTGGRKLVFKLALLDMVWLTGSVTNTHNEPIEKVRVIPTVAEDIIFTDSLGIFGANVTVTPGQGVLVRFTADGFLPESRYISADSWQAAEPIELNVSMRRGSFTFSGAVYDEYGNSIPSALVQITSRQARFHKSIQTDSDGHFVINEVLAAKDYQLKVTAGVRYNAFEQSDLSLAGGMGTMQMQLTYAPVGGLHGQVVDEAGVPVELLRLMVVSEGAGGRASTITTDPDGKYQLKDFVAGPVSLRSRTAPSIVIEDLEIEAGLDAQLDLTLDIGQNTVHGVLLSAAGLPVADASLRMRYRRVDPSGYKTIVKRDTKSDIEGVFRFDNLGAGNRIIEISARGYRQKSVSLDPTNNPGPHTWILTPAGS